MRKEAAHDDALIETWQLPYAARLGSSVRSKGLFLEIRAQLPKDLQSSLAVKAGELSLRVPAHDVAAFSKAKTTVSKALERISSRAVIPREIEDILGISTTERRRWLADGRLPSAGTRTLRLRGRGKITFHVFDPQIVQDLLAGDLIDAWREADAEKAAENRRRAIWKRKATPAQTTAPAQTAGDEERFKLRGWAEFERDGPLG